MKEAKIDLNELLQLWQRDGTDAVDQTKMVKLMLENAPALIEQLAENAGHLAPMDKDATLPPEYEDAISTVMKMASRLDEKTIGHWKARLARKCGMSLREFNNALSGQKKEDKGAGKSDENIIYTFGGEQIGDMLVEYCYDPDTQRSSLAVRQLPDGKAEMKDEVLIDGIKYRPIPPQNDRIVQTQTVLFPAKLSTERKTTRELAIIVEAFLRKNYLFDDPKHPRVISYYILLTWLYDNFRSISYLRAKGDAGSGKSELMKRVGLCCYRLTKNNGAGTMASFFRMTETYRGTVYFDEMDLRDGGGADNEIVKFINLGAMDGNPVIRLDEVMDAQGNKRYQPVPYRSFCPKLFAMREDFGDNAVGSRSISFRLMGKEAEELLAYGVPFEITDAMDRHARNIRNMLLTWRMYQWRPGKRELGNELVDPMVSSRMNQVTMPIKSLAEDENGNIDHNFLEQITLLLREIHSEQVQERSTTIDARVVEAIWRIYVYKDLREKAVVFHDGTLRIKVGDVTVVTNDIINEMNSDRGLESTTVSEEEQKEKRKKSRDIESRRVGKIIREVLNLKMLERTKKGYYFEWDELRMTVMGRKYGVLPEEELMAKAKLAVGETLGGQGHGERGEGIGEGVETYGQERALGQDGADRGLETGPNSDEGVQDAMQW